MAEEWTAAQCAAEWGVKAGTWRSYVAREQAPQPKRRAFGRVPLWSPAEVRGWPRPGAGARTDLRKGEAVPHHWHYAMLELIPEDTLVRPMISPEGEDLTQEQARQAVQELLNRLGKDSPPFAQLAQTWQRGAKDDWVYHGPFSLTIFECSAPTCPESFQAFANDYAATLRQAGMAVSVAKISDMPPA